MSVISREAAIKCLEMFLDKQCDRERTKERGFSDNDIWASVNMAYDALTAERVGKWERKWHTFFKRELPCCSACGKFEVFERNYCPYCGARMEGEAVRRIDDDPSHPFADGVMMKE